MSRIIPVSPFDLVIFGGAGDLARRKLLPGLYRRWADGQIPPDSRIIGAARTDMDAEAYRALAQASLQEHIGDALDLEVAAAFLKRLNYVTLDALGDGGWDDLAERFGSDVDVNPVRAFYLAVGPGLFGPISARLDAAGLITPDTRVVVEKPLGRDQQSAKALNADISAVFDESQIYRIDHYLGKETVQNLMALRFANALFEPIWNSRHIDHVQITVAETIGVEGRGGYYDRSGAMRDMVQNHLLQLLCLTAMEPPARFEAGAVRDEKLKILRALKSINDANADHMTVRGRYAGFAEDVGNPHSRTESYVALKAEVATWRWAGAPFYLRTGKKLQARASEIAVRFRAPPHSIFDGVAGRPRPNTLVIRVQPDEAVTLDITIKEPGPGGFRFTRAPLDMSYAKTLGTEHEAMPDAYERLIMDVIRGNPTLFMRGDEVEAAWAWVDPIIEAWEDAPDLPEDYAAGSSGPHGATELMARDGRAWREIV